MFELASLSKLRRVGLVRLPNLTDNAVFALSEKHAGLERIHLSYCDNISVGAIHFLLQRLPKLTHLSLTGIPQFRRKDLRAFCRLPPKVSQCNFPFTTLILMATFLYRRTSINTSAWRSVSTLGRVSLTFASTFIASLSMKEISSLNKMFILIFQP